MKKLILFSAALLVSASGVYGNTPPSPGNKTVTAWRTASELTIDGALEESVWQQAPEATAFWMNFPADTSLASATTITKVAYDDKNLYIGADVLHASAKPQQYIASSLRRDFPFVENDAFGVIIDAFSDNTNGYGFYVSAHGVQREEQIFNGTTADATWDIIWYSSVRQHERGYTVEMAIPLRYLRFRENAAEWNINFVRNDVSSNERSSWAATPRFFNLGNLAYHGKLQWSDEVKASKRNVSLIPSLSFAASQHQQKAVQSQLRPSLDAKVGITPSLNLDVTINPDFSQAEVDQAQVNLSRFELEFPEKRLFFIENSDLFSEFGLEKRGTSPVRPFYSRRIGLSYNATTGLYEQTQVLGGLRLSGKLNNNLRIGAMSIQTKGLQTEPAEPTHSKEYYPSQNYSVLALQQKVFSRSNIGVILVNRQAWGDHNSADYRFNTNDYNRVAGLDYNLASQDGKWTGKLYQHFSFTNNSDRPSTAQGGLLQYTSKRTLSWVGVNKVGKDFAPETGFVPRKNFTNLFGELSYFIYPKSWQLNYIQPILHYSLYLDSLSRNKTDQRFFTGLKWKFENTAIIYTLFMNDYTYLNVPFNPAQNEGPSLAAHTDYRYSYFKVHYVSDLRKTYSWQLVSDLGKFYNGNIAKFQGFLNRKIEPWGMVGINFNINFIRLPEPYANNNIFLLGPRAELSLSRSLFINSIVQYNSQNQNLNFYGRLQWRFRPLSDLYLVYSNNHNTHLGQRQNQSLVMKFVYWL
ncbi:membrane associated hydrolase [Flammeovirgaceae bacterium 311]|nr:membrane associated hydrolase [Flammeovirgaceae bacterium 311]